MDTTVITVAILIAQLVVSISCKHTVEKRTLPKNEQCDPQAGTCYKGDWVATEIASCEFQPSQNQKVCKPQRATKFNWVVEKDIHDQCKPVKGTKFQCGQPGTDTRCVCSNTRFYNFFFRNEVKNSCKCQYWPQTDIRASSPAFCSGYYIGGTSTVHHWACCNNCRDKDPGDCDGMTWQGGSTTDYCQTCGVNSGGGTMKYSFNCSNCSQQKACKKHCNGKFWYNKPGFCWKWLDCFKQCCEGASSELS